MKQVFRRIGLRGAMLIALAVVLPLRAGWAEDRILAVMFENGDLPPPAPDGSLLLSLFCEGSAPCGSVLYSDLRVNRLDEVGLDLIATVKVCQGTAEAASCVTARNAHFVGDALPVSHPDGTLFSEHMVEHDPIRCSDVTGVFWVPGCTGKLKLDYRCLNVTDLSIPAPIKALASSYVISEVP